MEAEWNYWAEQGYCRGSEGNFGVLERDGDIWVYCHFCAAEWWVGSIDQLDDPQLPEVHMPDALPVHDSREVQP